MSDIDEGQPVLFTGSNMLLPADSGEIPVSAAISQFEPGDFKNLVSVEKKTTAKFYGVVDTGASSTCLSNRLARRLQLPTIGKRNVSTANGETVHQTHIINLVLSEQVFFAGLEVTSGDIGDTDFLLGMDILRQAHFTMFPVHGRLFVDFKFFMPVNLLANDPTGGTGFSSI